MLSKERKISSAQLFLEDYSQVEQLAITEKHLPSKNGTTVDITDHILLSVYNSYLRVGICLDCGHTLSMIETAVKRHENPENYVGELAIKNTIENAVVKYFTDIKEKDAWLEGLADSRVMYDTISPETIDFLEQYLHTQPSYNANTL